MQEKIFNTKRLIVRKWRDSDIYMIQKVYGDKEAMRWVGDGKPISHEESQAWLKVTYKNYKIRGYGMYTVELQSTSEVVGFCGIVHPNQQVDAEIKYAFDRDYWGQGIATEAITGLIGYAVHTLGIKKLVSSIAPENYASERVLLKAGMQHGELSEDDEGLPTQYFYMYS